MGGGGVKREDNLRNCCNMEGSLHYKRVLHFATFETMLKYFRLFRMFRTYIIFNYRQLGFVGVIFCLRVGEG